MKDDNYSSNLHSNGGTTADNPEPTGSLPMSALQGFWSRITIIQTIDLMLLNALK
jgi:hypothetical protein